ncbi:RNA recognition family protein, partial [Cryptosporidium andersoni]
MFQRDAPLFESYHTLQYVASSVSQNSESYNKPAYYLNGVSQINNRANNMNYYEKSDMDTSLLPGMTTVYVGQIPLSIADVYIRRLLNECGRIMKWNRSEDPTTKKLSSFGLCEFDSPIGVINAVKALNGLEICAQECSSEPDIKSNNEDNTKGSNLEIPTCSNMKILSDNYKVNEKEIYREKAFLETQKECYVICRDLDMLRYKITRDIPGCFHGKLPDLEHFLFNMLEENFEDLDDRNFDQVSLIIDMDLEKITNNKETSFYKEDDNKLCDLYGLKDSDNIDKSKKIILDIRKLDSTQTLKCDAI